MAITSVKIHPAIGIARLGNSPSDFFVGPETTADPMQPSGGYKDDQCRVKRQAARFRLYAYDESGVATELTTANADITWTVALGNRKASSMEFAGGGLRNNHAQDRSKLDILPLAGTLHGPSQLHRFNTGSMTVWRTDHSSATATVDLGEARTDPEGRLLVLGGFGKSASPTGRPMEGNFADNDEWYDDISDGPIKATVTVGGTTFSAEGAWVIVAPPKYAPPVINAITLWDRLFDFFVQNGLLPAPTTTSFARDVYPVLRAALDVQDANGFASGVHNPYIVPSEFPISDPARRAVIFNALKKPADLGGGGTMPLLAGGAALTRTQVLHMQRWKDGVNTDTTWPVSPPAITPAGLDRAALFHAVGAAFYPGIEAGEFLIGGLGVYSSPFRINHAVVRAGDVSARMAVPWQSDFAACGDSWWPANRPNQVRIAPGGSVASDWDRNHEGRDKLVNDWPILGFVVDQSGERIEGERCDAAFIDLITSQLLFQDVPQGPGGTATTTARALVFEISSDSGPVTLEWVSGAQSGGLARLSPGPFTVGPTTPGNKLTVRLWITYTTGAVGSSVADNVIVRHQQSGKTWTIPIQANTVPRKTTAVALALDHSGSMSEPTGTGITKIVALQQAVAVFTDVAFQGDGIGAAQFNHTAAPIIPITALGPNNPFDPSRANFKSAVDALTPTGSTSVGSGLAEARTLLGSAAGFDRQALVVLTDGKENHAPTIPDVAPTIDAFTYAIGLGNADNVNAQVLQTLTGNRGGYLLLTGPITGDNRFVVTKYFLQILAGISNAAIITDPQGSLQFGERHRIPFRLTETEMMADIVLLSPYPSALQFELQTPLGIMISPASGLAGVEFVDSKGLRFYRLRLPLILPPERPVQAGVWHAVITQRERIHDEGPNLPQGRVPYNLSVYAGTDLAFHAFLRQDDLKPGAILNLTATLSHFGIPWEADARVWAEVTTPSSTFPQVTLDRIQPGEFAGKFVTGAPGVYSVRVRAEGKTPRGWRFQREQTVTGAVFVPGTDEPNPHEEEGRRIFTERAKFEAESANQRARRR